MSKPDRVISMISIAAKGRNLVSGEFAVEKAVKCGKAYLVVVAEDASDNTKKQFRNMCEFYEVPMVVYGNKDTLGHFIGTQMRANIAITDEGIANSILKSVHNGK
ncbi:MAG: ribosomal L7Ae/L30e/S12e/Gadd45 family protein [Lachnospiraceae bacterium]|nr:ribosomal L7Ae/L30e/S12e/Gadd45 family protein [Lachnospiraceae bacterium]MDD5852539.1 ribosomal L7Ae/L30e/S12e/Gadd45 family protein [Lachnospiraceae bacterium]